MKDYSIRLYFLSFFIFFSLAVFPEHEHKHEPSSIIKFTENKNQWDKNILYRAQLDGGVLFMEKDGFTYNFYDKETVSETHFASQNKNDRTNKNSKISRAKTPIKSHAFRMTFVNSELSVETSANQPTQDYCNYFIGNDKSKWASNVKNYGEVNYKNIYKNIHLQILGLQNSIKYNFYVAPQADIAEIELLYEGVSAIRIDAEGALHLKTSLNELMEEHPIAYQWAGNKQVQVPCEFVLEGSSVHFNFPQGYDKSKELIIDPVLVFAATSGSTASNFGHTATYDADGNLYSGGIAFGQGFPTTLGAFDTIFSGGDEDVVITKYDATGTFLQYSTYLGGTSDEIVSSLIVDAQNNLYLYGVTGSADFPVSINAYDKTFNGGLYYIPHPSNGNTFSNGTDIFVAEFNATGTFLLASTYIGGSGNDGVNSNNVQALIAIPGQSGLSSAYPLDSLQYNYGDYYRGEIDLDKTGNVVITTSTRSSDFPIINGFDKTLGGQQDAIVFKMNNNLSQLIWSTYLGGSDNDCANALVLDDSSNVYVTGGTRSSDFPATIGAKQTVYGGGKADGYITKIKADGSANIYSTYWGTSAYDQCYFVQLDKKNNVYTFGQTEGVMPVIGSVYNNPNSGQFITKMNDSLSNVIFSTVFGNGNGIPNISPTAFLIDNCENIYVSGWADGFNTANRPSTTGMPVTSDALDGTTQGYDFFLMALTKNATSRIYATYFGGDISAEHVHGGTSRYDKKGIVYQSLCTGCGGYNDFPGTPGAYPNEFALSNGVYVPLWNGAFASGGCNNGVFKLDFQQPLTVADFVVDHQNTCALQTIHFTNKSSPGTTFLWDFGGGDTTSKVANPVRTYSVSGTYLVKLYVSNPANCNPIDSLFKTVTINTLPPPVIISNNNDTICSGESLNNKYLVSNILSPFIWVATDNPNVKGESTILQYSDSITDILTNLTNSNQTVIYTITPTSGMGDCDGMAATFTVMVFPTIKSKIGLTSVPCTNQVNFTDITNPTSTSRLWDFGDGGFSIQQNPFHLYSTPSAYTVTLKAVHSSNSLDCSVPTDTSIDLSVPAVTTVNENKAICNNNSIQLNATGGVTYKWLPASSLNNSLIANPIASPITTTTYTVYISILNPSGIACMDTLTTTVNVLNSSIYSIKATADKDSILQGESTIIHAITDASLKVKWIDSTGSAISNNPDVTVAPKSTTTYTVSILDSVGCPKTATVTIVVLPNTCNPVDVFVPNTFTPNNDGKNDMLYVRGNNFSELYFAVYNRWGQLVFETTDKTKGWNGVYNSLETDPVVFAWYLKVKCYNGNQIEKKGNVTLIR
jgi:gliding motility-associated-like protein